MQTSRPALVVSIHDVSPLTAGRVEAMLGDLATAGLDHVSLLVIPNHHHKAPIAADLAFGTWLRKAAAQGHETVLHGYFHQRPAQGNWQSSLVTEFYTAGEGEFYDLSAKEATTRLEQGKSEFADIGIGACGFIAPAWLLGSEAEEAVRIAGFDYTTRLTSVKDLKNGREVFSQSLVWSVRAGWRRLMSRAWNANLAHRLKDAPLLRVGLHPPDWDYPAIRAQALRLIRAALAGREGITYEEWLKRSRFPA